MKIFLPLFVFLPLFIGCTNAQTAIRTDCPAEGKTDDSRAKIVDLLRQELDYRRSTQWNIFSWCSTLLIAIVGGVIALQKQNTSSLHLGQQVIVSLAVAVLAAYAVVWLTHNADRETRARECITQQVKYQIWAPRSYAPGDRAAVVVLGIAALGAIWFPLIIFLPSAQSGSVLPSSQSPKHHNHR